MKTNVEQQSMAEVAALALRVGREHREKLREMKEAFGSGDIARATDLAREICGIRDKGQAQQ